MLESLLPMRLVVLLIFIGLRVTAFSQELRESYRVLSNDTGYYFIKLSSNNPFTIDSVVSFGGKRINFFSAEDAGFCNSVICSEPGEYIIGFQQLESMRPLSSGRRVEKNRQIQPTGDYQKGVSVFTRHGKKLRRIAVTTFLEVPPGDMEALPSMPRGAANGDR